jgi:hypothetical protein
MATRQVTFRQLAGPLTRVIPWLATARLGCGDHRAGVRYLSLTLASNQEGLRGATNPMRR